MKNSSVNLCQIAFWVLAIVVSVSIQANAQFQGDVFRPRNDALVIGHNNQGKALAWAGGVNQPQFAMADLNNDGKNDLVIFEENVTVKTFISIGSGVFRYDSKYEANFPTVFGYMKLMDFNRDGVRDLIHRNFKGIGLYHGYISGGELKFKYYKDLEYPTPSSGNINAYVSPADIPGAADIDGDGDIDFMSYGVLGSYITLYKNCQVENNMPKDSVVICLKDNCWGKTQQLYEREQLIGITCSDWGTTCKTGRGQQKTTHGSNTLCAVDIDGDGDYDYFNGNESFPDIQLLYNGKKDHNYSLDSVIAQDTIWSADGKAMFAPIFPAAFALNINNDNDIDLIFAPHAQNTENYKSVIYYENTGTSSNPKYEYRSDTFLVDQMIDVGKASYPLFYDFDRDGKKDLFIGSDGYYQHQTGTLKSRIAYYKNISNNNFGFALQTEDFLGLSGLDFQGTALAIGDLDSDSLDDLVIGRSDGTFAFFRNVADSANAIPKWQLAIDTLKDVSNGNVVIDVGDFAAPCIYDIDGDGKKDLISGNQLGDLYYFNNNGNIKGFVGLKQITKNLGGIKIGKINKASAYTTPFIGRMDDTEKDYLVIGCEWGQLYRYDSFQNGANPATYTMIDSSYSFINVYNRSAPAFANVDNDDKNMHEGVVGSILGGLTFYRQDFPVTVSDKVVGGNKVQVYPNPAKDVLNIKWDKTFTDNDMVNVQLISITGQVLVHNVFDGRNDQIQIPIKNVMSGTYYCIVTSASSKSAHTITILK